MHLSPEVAEALERARRQAVANIEALTRREQDRHRSGTPYLIALVVFILTFASALLINHHHLP